MAHKVVKASLSLLFTLAFSAAYGFPIDASDERFDGVEDNVIAGDFLDNLNANGSTITVLPVTPPGVGVLNVLPGTGNFIYIPEPEFSGVVTFSYTVETTDGPCGGPLPLPACADGGTVTLFVEPQADLPGDFAANDVSGSEDTTLALDITATFVDTSETTNIVLSGVPATATLSAGALQGDGSYILTPAQLPGLSLTAEPNFNGTINLDIDIEVIDSVADPDGITITDTDDGNIGFDATFTPVDDDPVLVGAVPSLVIDEDDSGGVNLAGLVDDPDGDTLFYAVDSISGGAIDPATTDVTGSILTVGLLADQVDAGSVTVDVSDGAGVPVSLVINVSVTPLNDPPFVVTAAVPTVDVLEDADAITIDVSPAFDDVDIVTSSDSLDFSIPVVADPLFDDVSLSGGSLTIDFAANANGVTSFPVTASDGDASVSFNLDVTVNPVPDEPRLIAPVPSLTIPEDGSDSVNVAALVDDFDIATNADSLSISVDGVSSAAILPGDVSLSAGVLTITPSANLFDPSGTVTIRVDDDDTNADVDSPVSLTFNVPVAVTSVNDIPVLVGTLPDIVTDEDVNPPSVDLSGLFDDADLATGGTLNFDIAVISGATILDGAPLVTGQSLQLTLAENQNGLVTIEVTGNDGETPPASLPSTTFELEVTPINDVPVVIGSLPPLNTLNEDDPDQTVSLLGLFDDVDIVTNGDSLRFEVSANTNEDLFF